MLEISDLIVGRDGRGVAALESRTLHGGEAALILGPSGSGKSTALFTLAGLLSPVAGSVRLDGQPFSDLSPARRAKVRGNRIGIVFQDMHLLSGLTVLDNLLLAPFASGQAQDVAAARLRLQSVGLGDLSSRPAERLSRGEAQRVAVARAMMLSPDLILADEPTASLDDDAALRITDLLLDAARDAGAALVIATHDQRLKDRIRGRLSLYAAATEAVA